MPTTTTGVATEFISFTRASNATVVDSNGLIDWAAHNLLLASEQFDSSNWTKASITVTANYAAAPNGTTTADRAVYVGSLGTPATKQLTQAVAISTSELRTTFGIWVSGTGKFRVQNVHGGVLANYSSDITATATPTLYTLTVTNAANAGNGFQVAGICAATTDDAFDLNVWGAHLYRSDLGGMQANTSAYPMYNPTTPKNMLGFTENFDNAFWGKSATTATANALVAPNGLSTADKLAETATTAVHIMSTAGPVSVTSGGVYTFSIYAKAAERSHFALFESTTAKGKFFDLSSGTVLGNLNAAPLDASITAVGTDGWYRCSIEFTGGASAFPTVYLSTNGTIFDYAGTAGSGIYLWGAQLSDSASLDPYVANHFTAPSAAAYYGPRRDFDSAGVCKGLLVEEQRANLLLHTAAFDTAGVWFLDAATVSANSTVAPDGTTTADKLVENSATATHDIYQQLSSQPAGSYTYSIYVKASGRTKFRLQQSTTTSYGVLFDLTALTATTAIGGATGVITNAGNGWYRCSMTYTTVAAFAPTLTVFMTDAAGALSYTGDGTSGLFVYGAQLEAGSFATSYIPTTTASATRSADVAQVGTAAFPYSATEGTLVANGSFMGLGLAPSSGIATLSDGTSANSIAMFRVSGSSTLKLEMLNASSIQATYTVAMGVQPSKAAFAYAANNSNSALNGTAQTDDTTCTVPAMDRLLIGSTYAAGNLPMNGWVRQITYLPRRLSNAELQTRTA